MNNPLYRSGVSISAETLDKLSSDPAALESCIVGAVMCAMRALANSMATKGDDINEYSFSHNIDNSVAGDGLTYKRIEIKAIAQGTNQ